MYDENCFLTLTYSDEHIGDGRLNYEHVRKFQKDLRNLRFQGLLDKYYPGETQKQQRAMFNSLAKDERERLYDSIRVSFFIAGEYGAKKKRAHWHVLVFNYSPSDAQKLRVSERGDAIFSSLELSSLWRYGISEFGAVTFESAGYCARYAAKKLVHGNDADHDLHPISRRSCRNAIGKKWIEENWKDCFTHGYLVFKKGDEFIQCGIPRYYEKWLQKYRPLDWEEYVTRVKQKNIDSAQAQVEKLEDAELKANSKRIGLKKRVITHAEQKAKILKQKFKKLQDNLKL